ncbi:hypothetical protein BKA82DRAFT_11478 [Pisolithus tinctorius]|uniref:Uncharacterized protein n=1 Tax=Pisolithus tinctorius Marx 270 TaxID=870435 RepID=A0A0C3I7M6_PISTI|nr:hypothetical protein BKA82DRAFT_11478 [Pisolithus tinctorius]KIN93157.1 hypothetical protein M404DRAFT_11478 [Pisolithus tinctorius Marx 270]
MAMDKEVTLAYQKPRVGVHACLQTLKSPVLIFQCGRMVDVQFVSQIPHRSSAPSFGRAEVTVALINLDLVLMMGLEPIAESEGSGNAGPSNQQQQPRAPLEPSAKFRGWTAQDLVDGNVQLRSGMAVEASTIMQVIDLLPVDCKLPTVQFSKQVRTALPKLSEAVVKGHKKYLLELLDAVIKEKKKKKKKEECQLQASLNIIGIINRLYENIAMVYDDLKSSSLVPRDTRRLLNEAMDEDVEPDLIPTPHIQAIYNSLIHELPNLMARIIVLTHACIVTEETKRKKKKELKDVATATAREFVPDKSSIAKMVTAQVKWQLNAKSPKPGKGTKGGKKKKDASGESKAKKKKSSKKNSDKQSKASDSKKAKSKKSKNAKCSKGKGKEKSL